MTSESHRQGAHRVAIIGSYAPPLSSMATFTSGLCEALAAAAPALSVIVAAVIEPLEEHACPAHVQIKIARQDRESYQRAAASLRRAGVDLVCVQHDFDIYGGPAGEHLLAMLDELDAPVVATLHSVPEQPAPEQQQAVQALARRSARLVVMSQHAAALLREAYAVAKWQIAIMPHGIALIDGDPARYKAVLGMADGPLLLTSGPLSASAGIEQVLAALPVIILRHPTTRYVILSTTGPQALGDEGKIYRASIARRARDLMIAEHVILRDQCVSPGERTAYIGACDIYLTPHRGPGQSVSEVLPTVVGNGRAVISTPHWHAKELLAEGRGVLVPFDLPAAIAVAVIRLLSSHAERRAIAARARSLGSAMAWPEVGSRYARLFAEVWAAPACGPPPRAELDSSALAPLPPVQLDHLRHMTDSTGLLRQVRHNVPDYSKGYTTNDNALGLLAMAMLAQGGHEPADNALATRYLAFLWHAFSPTHGRFHNLLSYDRTWRDGPSSEGCYGHALWALGAMAGGGHPLQRPAMALFLKALPAVTTLGAPCARARALLGLRAYLGGFGHSDQCWQLYAQLAESVMADYCACARADWPWFEPQLASDSARLPQALLLAANDLRRADMSAAALESLRWLDTAHYPGSDHFVPVGGRSRSPQGAPRARFEQQPLEASAAISAYLAAYQSTGDTHWYLRARQTFEWFRGHNDTDMALYNPGTGGCHDGIEPDGVSPNQGAEATLAVLIALLDLELAEHPSEVAEAQHGLACQAVGERAAPWAQRPGF